MSKSCVNQLVDEVIERRYKHNIIIKLSCKVSGMSKNNLPKDAQLVISDDMILYDVEYSYYKNNMIKYMKKIDFMARKDTVLILKLKDDGMEIDNLDPTDTVLIFIILEDINWVVVLVSCCTTCNNPNICNIWTVSCNFVIKHTWILISIILVQLLDVFH